MPRDSLLDFFEDFAPLRSEFLVYDDGFRTKSYRYCEVADLARAFAARLHAAGIHADQKIIIYCENRPEWIVALWGCLLAGVVLVPIDFRSSPEFVERIRTIVDAKAILVGEAVHLPPNPIVWTIAGLNHPQGFPQGFPQDFSKVIPAANPTAEIIFTSGATAEPKGVILTHGNILANIVPVEREVKKYQKWSRPFAPIHFLNLLPLSHMFGQAMGTFIPPMLPGVVVFMSGFSPSEIIRQIRTRRISVLVSVPKILEILRAYLIHRYPELAQPETRKMH